MSQRTLLTLLIVGAALLYLRRTGAGAVAVSPILNGGLLGQMPGGGFRFPRLPADMAFTTDPATGQVYVVERGYGGPLPWVSTSDVLRGG